jgi:hypothetical protein
VKVVEEEEEEVKFSLSIINKHHAMKTYGGMKV